MSSVAIDLANLWRRRQEFDASATESLLTGVLAFIAGAAAMPFKMK